LRALGLLVHSPALVDKEPFALMLRGFSSESSADRAAATRLLSEATLTTAELTQLAEAMVAASPVERALLLRAFGRSSDSAAGRALLAAARRGALDGAPAAQIEAALAKYPPDLRASAQPLFDALERAASERKERLVELERAFAAGNPRRGEELFRA